MLTCEGTIHKDCSLSFCMSRQGIININKASSFFSFRKRSKFTKMAEHFEYNHIPAHLSSIQNFHVKSVLCFRENIVVLHLARNVASQFGLLDLRTNKFLGLFCKQAVEFWNECLAGEISPDKSRCCIKLPSVTHARTGQPRDMIQVYDLETKLLICETLLNYNDSLFAFDPRFAYSRLAITNFERNQQNSLSLVKMEDWEIFHTNPRVDDRHNVLHPYIRNLSFTRDGSLIFAVIVDNSCHCRERKSRNYQPVDCSIYAFSSDTSQTLHCIQYQRYTCTRHLCPVNYMPVFSNCGSRMALVLNLPSLPVVHYVQVYKLPAVANLQALCRVSILQQYTPSQISSLPLPPKLISYLKFKPEFP